VRKVRHTLHSENIILLVTNTSMSSVCKHTTISNNYLSS